jgi:hypothetical protein
MGQKFRSESKEAFSNNPFMNGINSIHCVYSAKRLNTIGIQNSTLISKRDLPFKRLRFIPFRINHAEKTKRFPERVCQLMKGIRRYIENIHEFHLSFCPACADNAFPFYANDYMLMFVNFQAALSI